MNSEQLLEAPEVAPGSMGKIDRVIKSLGERIKAREWDSEQALPSRSRLSEEYGVSPTTVSIAIRQLQKKGMVRIVSSKGVFVADAAGQSGEAVFHPMVGVRRSYFSCEETLERMTNEDLFGLLNIGGIFEAASGSNCPVLLLPGSLKTDQLNRSYCESLGVQGVIFFVWGSESLQEALNLRQAGFPVILANKPVGSTPLNFVDYDARGEVREVVRQLTGLGHRKIGVICAQTPVPGYYERLKLDFIEALEEAGVYDSIHDYWRFVPRKEGHREPFHEAEAAAEALLDLPEPPTALFCWLPQILTHVQRVADRRGLRAPKDLSLICSGFHGEKEADVTGFIMPHKERGRLLLQEIHETIRNPFHCAQKLIPCRLVDRGTVGPLPQP
ncbi:MAG TPA: GntR family transcriptional regulator [Chthoniobacteraceae bacterium]|nr:GntR family transcriptional regulator [Chthoniobacteraceae bacterium]